MLFHVSPEGHNGASYSWKLVTYLRAVLALVWEVVGVLLALVANHGRTAVEALVAVFACVQLNAVVTVCNVVSQLHTLEELGTALVTLVPAHQNAQVLTLVLSVSTAVQSINLQCCFHW